MSNAQSQRFVQPCKEAIRAAIVTFGNGFTDLTVSFNSIERDPATGANILLSRQVPPTTNRKTEMSNSGRTGFSWLADDGSTMTRHLAAQLEIYFDVTLFSPSLYVSTDALFHLIATLPRSIFDGHMLSGVAVQPEGYAGNPIELTAIAPVLPDDTVSTAKQYRSSLLVKASGNVYRDMVSSVPMRGAPRLAPDTGRP